MILFFVRLFTGCWFTHQDMRTRDDHGRPQLLCQTCGSRRLMLDSAVIRGPKAEPDEVLGRPKMTAVLESKVASLKRKAG